MGDEDISRRKFLAFLGRGTLGLVGASLLPALPGCTRVPASAGGSAFLTALKPTTADDLSLAEGLHYRLLLRWEDQLRPGLRFGFNNDYIAFLPIPGKPDEAYLWVNHEYLHQQHVHRFQHDPASREQFERERSEVGGSIVHLRRGAEGWQMVPGSELNRRVDAATTIPFAWPTPIQGKSQAVGTLGNCAGGYTPWGTVLTCEENYDLFYGERNEDGTLRESEYHWEKFEPNPPEHYGWVVEVNPATGEATKLVSMGRCAHECATVKELPDGRCVVYTGDDANDQFIYKFISRKPGSLTEGDLYVANTETGTWLLLDHARQPLLQQHFKDQTEVLVYMRKAAKLLGATPQDRPEDIEIDPLTGHVFISCTMNLPKGNYLGHILRIDEGGDYESPSFRSEIFLAGGSETGFACPDNLAFDPRGGLWFTSDIPSYSIEKEHYVGRGNNGLFYVPAQGPQAGQVIQIASGPVGSELTGPCFIDGGRTLLLSVQHPGENSESLEGLTSHWPDGGNAYPRPSVVVLTGPLLETYCAV